jgi:nicotinamide phosphoribosyltransferase
MRNFILATDSYKHSHFRQYPPEARRISAYVESRTNNFSDDLVFFGLQAFLMEYLSVPITSADVAEADAVCTAHGIPFNKSGWQAIVDDHKGFLPIEIRALPEGMVAPTSVPLVQVENTDDRMPWLSTFVETALLRGIWYPTTVATLSGKAKKIIHAGLVTSSDDPMARLPFALHDFGARGVSSAESAALGGLGHLVNFMGTDTMEALMAARRYYAEDMAGYSIPAAEHSTMTSWGRAREEAAYANMLDAFKAEGKIVAVVSDSYDLDKAISNIWGGSLKAKILGSGGTLVVRPDSGDPVETPVRALHILWEKFGGSLNSKGYRVLDSHVRLIQGDGMNIDSIARLVARVIDTGFAIDNIAFGMGGGLLQLVNRDTLRFAMKANAMQDPQGVWHDVSKSPATDPAKGSKAGRQAVVLEGGRLVARRMANVAESDNLLTPVWRAGTLLRQESLATIRTRSEKALLA